MAALLHGPSSAALCSHFRILLASQSPRRKELLQLLGVPFDVAHPDFAEDLDKRSFATAADYVLATAAGKCQAVRSALPPTREDGRHDLVICADTVVVLDGDILEKPADSAAARRMLTSLSGRVHEVLTAVVVGVQADARDVHSLVERTEVTFHELSQAEVDAYIETGEPFDKAGGYGIQSKGSLLVKGISGDYFNVVGLPIASLARLIINVLNSHGVAVDVPAKRRKLDSRGEDSFIDKLALVCVRDRRQLVARSRGKQAFFTPGGKRETGESDQEALVREIREELGVRVLEPSIRIYGVFQAQAYGKPTGTMVRLTCYRADFEGTPAPCNEIEELRWITSSEDRKLLTVTGNMLLDDLRGKGLVD